MKLYLMVGLPGSGKSTWIQEQIKDNKRAKWISRDKIRFELVGHYINKDNYFSQEKRVVQRFLDDIRFACFKYNEVYADATHLNPSSRGKVLRYINDLVQAGRVEVIAVFINTPIDQCIANDSTREGVLCVGEEAIRKLATGFILPSKNEGFKEVMIV